MPKLVRGNACARFRPRTQRRTNASGGRMAQPSRSQAKFGRADVCRFWERKCQAGSANPLAAQAGMKSGRADKLFQFDIGRNAKMISTTLTDFSLTFGSLMLTE